MEFHWLVTCPFFAVTWGCAHVRVAFVASVSVRFRSKERGTRVKDRAKNGTSKKAEWGWRRKANLADQNKQQPLSRTIPSSQYETNLWSTHVNIVRLTEPIRRCVRWRTQVFKIEGFVCKRFLPSPPPPPTFIFWLLFHFSRGQNRESRFLVFLCSKTKRKRLLRRLMWGEKSRREESVLLVCEHTL